MDTSRREIIHRANFLIFDYLKNVLKQKKLADEFRELIKLTEYKDIIIFKGIGDLVEILTQKFKDALTSENEPVVANGNHSADAADVEEAAPKLSKKQMKKLKQQQQEQQQQQQQEVPTEEAEAETVVELVSKKKKKKAKKQKEQADAEVDQEVDKEVDISANGDANGIVAEANPAAVQEASTEKKSKKKKKQKMKKEEEEEEKGRNGEIDAVADAPENDDVADEAAAVDASEQPAAVKRKFDDESNDASEAKKQRHGQPYRRVREDEVENKHFRDNSFDAKANARDSWGYKANLDLKVTQGKSFRHEKTKKKRGSYKGGAIDTGVTSVKFETDSE